MKKLVAIAAVFAILASAAPVNAIMESYECYEAAAKGWMNISMNIECLMSIYMEDNMIDDWEDDDGWQ